MTGKRPSVTELIEGLRHGDRRTLARAITLVESRRDDDRRATESLLEAVLPSTGHALRIGVSGVPGVGKSSFLEALGTRLCERGERVAVLAIDPSSSLSGGSILGDKTRMTELARHERAFVRPSPGGTAHGGVAGHSREAMLLCEAAGFGVVFVETIGVGQSEHAVADLVDFFLLLVLAGAGDELQGIKRGILELADGVAVTKADGDGRARAEAAARELDGALHILRGGAHVPVWTCSARSGEGIDAIWSGVHAACAAARTGGQLATRRARQDAAWFERALDEAIRARFLGEPGMRSRVDALRLAVSTGSISPTLAARRAVDGEPRDGSA
ncbi:MAG: methylmalonyl Co-A mutase-associated GTPase MeaB [Planctomycetes bacterium]|nr:methylmalonyl Co-A mutase-associated GTPase MeaB [Planctomycetota bacterium]